MAFDVIEPVIQSKGQVVHRQDVGLEFVIPLPNDVVVCGKSCFTARSRGICFRQTKADWCQIVL